MPAEVSEILKSIGIEGKDPSNLERYMKARGYTRGAIRKAVRGFEKYKSDPSRSFVLGENNDFRVFNKKGQEITRDSRTLGNSVKTNLADLIGLGTDVSRFMAIVKQLNDQEQQKGDDGKTISQALKEQVKENPSNETAQQLPPEIQSKGEEVSPRVASTTTTRSTPNSQDESNQVVNFDFTTPLDDYSRLTPTTESALTDTEQKQIKREEAQETVNRGDKTLVQLGRDQTVNQLLKRRRSLEPKDTDTFLDSVLKNWYGFFADLQLHPFRNQIKEQQAAEEFLRSTEENQAKPRKRVRVERKLNGLNQK